MEWGEQFREIGIILLICCILLICGCVEVTPPAGTTDAAAYGSAGSSGNLTSGLDTRTPTPVTPGTGTAIQSPGTIQSTPEGGSNNTTMIPPDIPIVKVTPRSLEGLPVPTDTQSYSALNNRSAIGPNAEFITIYEINHSFANDAIAYAYTLENPPIYIDLKFMPVNGTDVISYQKRTGDKEGQIEITVNRPLKDAWFELRVYNQKDGSEVLREGFGKTYSQTNKTVVLRSSGSYQFDLVGNLMNASVILKVSVNSATLSQFQNVSNLIDTRKKEAGLIPAIYLTLSDLPADWKVSGDITHTDAAYESVFVNPITGHKLQQNIKRYDSTEKALAALAGLKTAASAESPAATLIGQGGFQYESVRKSEVAFVQSLYLVELVSYSVPAVTLADLQKYGGLMISRINTTG
ncbi:MAG: hypothetical protein LUQ50_08605 [Methanospirillum sp.]|uniref:hypothetical protein n=1 Tax=Methanospirillum sp. TaxID=45200 RepID=UPI0023690EA7|nr:hypothetical protein [Methanospirillum sp.]MDD1729117.1 hypothetical protein [Methanospirillum sp.]